VISARPFLRGFYGVCVTPAVRLRTIE
jgi:hypothetical protein